MRKKIKLLQQPSILQFISFFLGFRSKKNIHTFEHGKEINKKRTKMGLADESSLASKKNYFDTARSWSDDLYTSVIISRNRYKFAFFVAMGLATLLAIAVNGLIPLQHIEPLLVNHYQDGRVFVQPIHQPYVPINQAQVESDIVRYVINRESFDSSSYDEQYSLVNLLSNNEIAKQYMDTQSINNKQSPINLLGANGFRAVRVENVIFLDSVLKNQDKLPSKKTHYNLAQVNFTVTDHFKDSAVKKIQAHTVLIAWTYCDVPSDPADLWRNWNGFTVTRYTLEQRNV